eukprot:m.214378 g.214378  ORF g.214378 m.214378 type:complete len:187 (+) comp27132_c0_seq1:300-860(+)
MPGEQMIKTNQRTPIGEVSFVMGLVGVLLVTTATILPRMVMTEENNIKTTWGIWRKAEGAGTDSEEIECSDYSGAARACVACQAFSIIAIGAGVFGLAASIKVHDIFADFDKMQSTLLILGAGVSSLLVFTIFDAAIITGGDDENPIKNSERKESFVLFIIAWIMFFMSAFALYMSEDIDPHVAPR